MSAQTVSADLVTIVSQLANDGAELRPELAKRYARAIEYVISGACSDNHDGTWLVRSLTRDKQYTVNGQCDCPDARWVHPTTGAADGWCKHRLAVGLIRRAQRIQAEIQQEIDARLALATDDYEAARAHLSNAMRQFNAARAQLRSAERAHAASPQAIPDPAPLAIYCRHCTGPMILCETPGGEPAYECLNPECQYCLPAPCRPAPPAGPAAPAASPAAPEPTLADEIIASLVGTIAEPRPPAYITLKRAEGLIHECIAVTHSGSDAWQQADATLAAWAQTAPDGLGFHKCDYTILWGDHADFNGRYDLQRHDTIDADLAGHIRQHAMFYSGRWRPDHVSQQQHLEILEYYGQDRIAWCARLLDHYLPIGAPATCFSCGAKTAHHTCVLYLCAPCCDACGHACGGTEA